MTAAGQSTAQTISSQTAGQRCDKPRQRSREFNSRHSSDKLMTSGSNSKSSGVPAASNNNSKNMKGSQLPVSRAKSSQAYMAHRVSGTDSKPKDAPRKTSMVQLPATKKPSNDTRPKSTQVRSHGYLHRAEGVFDLSNAHLLSPHGGSVYDLLEEFKKQMNLPESSKPTNKTDEKVTHSRRLTGQGWYFILY